MITLNHSPVLDYFSTKFTIRQCGVFNNLDEDTNEDEEEDQHE